MTTSGTYVPDQTDNAQVVRDYMAAFENKDRAGFAALYTWRMIEPVTQTLPVVE